MDERIVCKNQLNVKKSYSEGCILEKLNYKLFITGKILQGSYYIKDLEVSDKFIPSQILKMVNFITDNIKVRFFQKMSVKNRIRKPLIKIFEVELLVKYTKPQV